MRALSLRTLEDEARNFLDPASHDYFAGGADDEVTLRANESAFTHMGLVPRVLCGADKPELGVTLLGSRVSMPVLIAPTAFHRLAHQDGERATVRAAVAARTIMMVSMNSTVAIEAIAAEARAAGGEGNLWFQLYLQPDLQFTETVVQRAEAAGCTVLVVTVDSPAFGRRERDLRNNFLDLPQGMYCEHFRDGSGVRDLVFSAEFSWDHIEWLRKATSLKVALKGIMHPADAQLALKHGADAIIVSNHGGRQLDTVPATINLLPAIADAIDGRIPVLMDGGIRRGTDVIKALALGATAVAIGRPVIWGLAIEGEAGVRQVLEMLRTEFQHALTLCGCSSLFDVTRCLVQPTKGEEQCVLSS
jgi:4-hydroxymandelate oxidase